MNRFTICAFIVLLGATGALLGVQNVFSYVTAKPSGDEVVVQWQTTSEVGVGGFEIERRSDNTSSFKRLARIEVKGSGKIYTFIDNSAFFKGQEQQQYTYRVKTIGGTVVYSSSATVVHDVSSVRKSWGMIKELFR